MGKKRKTRQEKIIAQLKRKLAKKEGVLTSESPKIPPRQEAVSKPAPPQPPSTTTIKKNDDAIFFYNPRLVKKDLFKTLILAIITLGLEFMLYLKLR